MTRFFAVERAARGEWWDLFCGIECARKVYDEPNAAGQIYTPDEFNDETGHSGGRCFACGNPVGSLAAAQEPAAS